MSKILSIKVNKKKFVTKEPQGHQSNNELYVIYKSGPFMAGSRFLEASLVHKRTASLEIRMLLYNELHHNVLCTFVRFYNTSLYGNSNFFLYLSLPMANFKCGGQDQHSSEQLLLQQCVMWPKALKNEKNCDCSLPLCLPELFKVYAVNFEC